MGKSQQKSPS